MPIVTIPTPIVPGKVSLSGNPLTIQAVITDTSVKTVEAIVFKKVTTYAEEIARWVQPPDMGSTDTYTFRVEQVVQDNLGIDLQPVNGSGYFAADNSCLPVIVFLQGSDSSYFKSINFHAVNGGIAVDQSESIVSYFMEAYPQRFLTHSPREKWVGLYDSEYVGLVTNYQGPVPFLMNIDRTNKDGSTATQSINVTNVESDVKGDVAVGPANLNALQAGFITEDTLYYDLLMPVALGSNQFTDGDSGTFASNVDGIVAGTAIVDSLYHEPNYGSPGIGTMRIELNSNAPAGGELWHNSTLISLNANTTYHFSCKVKFFAEDPNFVDPFTVTLELLGTTGSAFHMDGSTEFTESDPSDYKHVMGQLNTNAATSGYLQMSISNGKANDTFFVDTVVVTEVEPTAIKRYKLDHQCHTNPTRVHFLNRLGAMDSFTFTGTEKRRVKTDSSQFTKRLGYNYNAGSRGRQVIYKQASESLICSTGPLTAEEMLWLEELLTSPEVYIQEDGVYKPVVLKDGSFDTVDGQKNIHKLSVELERANNVVTQRT